MEKEIRSFNVDTTGLEVRNDEDDKPKIKGYAAVFDSLSEQLGFFREKIEKGAFSRSIIENEIKALWNHNDDYVIGTKSRDTQTLKLEEDDHGLRVEIDPPKWADWIVESIERGDVKKMSFGFFVRKDEWDESDPKNPVRTLKEVELLEVSPVTFPAYPETSVTARAIKAMRSLFEKHYYPNHNHMVDDINRHTHDLTLDDNRDGDEDVKPKIEKLERQLEFLKGKVELLEKINEQESE